MFIPDPGSWFLPVRDPKSRIPDPKTATKERWKKLDVKPFYVATKFNNIVNYFSFEVLKKKIWANFQRIIELFTKKIVKALQNMVLGSGIPDPGVKKAPDPQHWVIECVLCSGTSKYWCAQAELNELLTRELAEDGYSGVEVRVTPTRTEIIIMATRTQNVLGEKGRR
jgi:hypothetical protein